MRGLTRLVAIGALVACASPQTPPGGPVDEDAPQLVRMRPDTNATNVRAGAIGFEFDEVISERPQGAPSLAELFLISPSTGANSLSWRRTRLEVKPRGGLRPNTTYSVVMLPGLTDLDGNVDSVGTSLVFSTGPSIATGRLRGVVFDWMAERAAPRAFIEAFALPDSTRYLGFADSTGRYDLANLPPGRYLVRALVDQNRNRILDPREPFDTTSVTLADSLRVALHAVARDTLGPSIERVELVDSLTLRVRFDRALDTTFVINPSVFVLKAADSTNVQLASAVGGRAFQRQRDDSTRVAALQDSVRRAQQADSARRADSVRTGRVAPRPVAPRPAPAADTTREPPLKPAVRIPDVEAVLRLSAPLSLGSAFRLRAVEVRSIVGVTRSSERTFTTPRARPAADTAAARDTGSTSSRGLSRPTVSPTSARGGVGGPPHRENDRESSARPDPFLPARTIFPPSLRS
jgi:hypothetical protein